MDLAAQHALAILPKRFTVLGQTLEPFTLGHALLLTRLGSPYAPFGDPSAPNAHPLPAEEGRGEGKGTDQLAERIGDLVLAIWVCAQPWRHAEKHLASRRTRLLLRAWQWQLTSHRLIRAAAFFHAYLVESTRGPRTFTKDTDNALRSPTLAVVRVMLANAFGLTPDEAMDVPLAAALWDLACYHELKGSVELVDPIRAAALEAARHSPPS